MASYGATGHNQLYKITSYVLAVIGTTLVYGALNHSAHHTYVLCGHWCHFGVRRTKS